jgi:hypothetical protein
MPRNGASLDQPASVEIYRPFFVAGMATVPTAGCLLGAIALFEIATDYTPAAFAPMGITGFVELLELAWWAVYLVRILLTRRTLAAR